MLNVNEYEIDYTSGLFTCCEEELRACHGDLAHIGMELECEHCGQKMKLTNVNGKTMWRLAK